MDLTTARKNFFSKHKGVYANFCYNERLNKNVCYTFDYTDKSASTNVLSEDTLQKIYEYAKTHDGEPFHVVMSYFAEVGIDDNLLEQISNLYYVECFENNKTFTSVAEVCDAINGYVKLDKNTENTSNRSIVACYILDENGQLADRVFYMEVKFVVKNGVNVCVIENTFTDENYRSNGLHGYGIKFLEAVLPHKEVYQIVGEAVDMDMYENGSLNEHYKNLGFEVTTNKSGESVLYKSVEPESSMQITADREIIR